MRLSGLSLSLFSLCFFTLSWIFFLFCGIEGKVKGRFSSLCINQCDGVGGRYGRKNENRSKR